LSPTFFARLDATRSVSSSARSNERVPQKHSRFQIFFPVIASMVWSGLQFGFGGADALATGLRVRGIG
jgi:hypothetical protein